MRGTDLLKELSAATGLPDELIGEELSRLICGAGKSTESVTLDELRELLGAYLQDVLLEAKSTFENDEGARAELQSAASAVASIESPTDKSAPEKNTATFAVFRDLGEL